MICHRQGKPLPPLGRTPARPLPRAPFCHILLRNHHCVTPHRTKFASLTAIMRCFFVLFFLAIIALSYSRPYDPNDDELKSVLTEDGNFEAFYPRQAHGIPNGSSRPAHGHGSFYKHRNPALVDVKNAAAYGFRFDGMRRFNFEDDE